MRIDINSVKEAAEAARIKLKEKEKFLLENNVTVRPNLAEQTHLRFSQSNQKTRDENRDAMIALAIASEVANKYIHL